MQVFFIYDTAYCKADEDDPKDAVVYFFPAQAMENQRYSLCCQLVGVAKFFKANFSSPSLIVLDQWKFAFYWSGKYLLALGGSLDVRDSILKSHVSFLCGIFCFYHGSVNNLLKECKNNRREFLTKMELAWSRYITLFRCFDNLLQLCLNPLPLTIYKKHSNAILKATQLLHLCQLSSSVLAGAVFCNSMVLSSQLTPEITSFLTLMSNANAAAPVSSVSNLTLNLPPDVELKYVYLCKKAVQSILKYNHNYVGSRLRMKTSEVHLKHPYPLTHCCDESSGSEGDVDSGNCSENVPENKNKKDKISEPKKVDHLLQSYLKSLNYNKCITCCQTHIALQENKIAKSQNHICLQMLSGYNNVNTRSKMPKEEDIATHSKMKTKRLPENFSQNDQIFSVYDFCDKPNYCENVENSDLEKTVLYVQRYGINTLLLFMNKNYDEDVITYLWNCGFSLLKDIEYEPENKSLEKGYELESSYYVLLCNNAQKVLKEQPICPSIFAEKSCKESVQVIQEDFLLNPDFHMMSLLTTDQNIFACQTKQHSAFYLQPDTNSRKVESLCSLSKKAVRRLDKFLKVT